MSAMGLLLFPNSGSGEDESDDLVGDNLSNFMVQHQTSLGVIVSSEGNGLDNNSVMTKKLNHNANERNRRKKFNSVLSSLRSCLPDSGETKLSIPQTMSQSVQYITELREEVKKLMQKKEDLLLRVQQKAVARYVSTVFATRLSDNEIMVQIASSKVHNFSISNVLSGLEKDGFVLVNVSSSSCQGEHLFYTLHLLADKIDNFKLNCEELSQRVLYLYERCGN